MISLIIDTETTGFPLWKSEVSDPGQPGMVELAWELYCHERHEIMVSFSSMVQSGVHIPEEVTAIHGITNEDVARYGMLPYPVMELFLEAVSMASRIVAHNMNFDKKILQIALHRANIKSVRFEEMDKFCTMLATTPILKLPGKTGGYKWPTLDEAYCALVDLGGRTNAHRAASDVKACREIMIAYEKLPRLHAG